MVEQIYFIDHLQSTQKQKYLANQKQKLRNR